MASYKSVIPFIRMSEGGLANAKTDKGPAADPSPFIYNGHNKWPGDLSHLTVGLPIHTVKGITWRVFKDASKVLGFEPNEANFIFMPDNIWESIFKKFYWDIVHGDEYDSQAIANNIVHFAWGSGLGGAMSVLIPFLASKGIKADGPITIKDGINKLTKEEGENKAFNELIDARKAFLVSLHNPTYEVGWLRFMEVLRKEGMGLIGQAYESTKEVAEEGVQVVKKNPVKVIVIISIALISIYTLVVYTRK